MTREDKEKVIELIKTNFEIQSGGDVEDAILEQIEALPVEDTEVTIKEVKDVCSKNDSNNCKLRQGLFKCLISEDPNDWDIEAIAKAIKGA